jgi:histone acetyltransferase (RNA polymerase elongator complex component)
VWEREIGCATGLVILHSNVVVSESIWGQHCGLGNGIIDKAERYTAESIECGREKLEVQQGWISFIVM